MYSNIKYFVSFVVSTQTVFRPRKLARSFQDDKLCGGATWERKKLSIYNYPQTRIPAVCHAESILRQSLKKESWVIKSSITRLKTEKIYYFHPDHLGTKTFLTDANGDCYQFFLNLPFGETMAEQKSITQNYATPYKFTGKELDEETGLYYFGARYYAPRESIWLSVDPLAEQTPEWSPYAFCNNNPLFFTDPTGMSASPIYDQEGTFMGTDDEGLQGKAIVMKKDDFTQGMKHEDAMKKDLAPNGGSEYYKAISDYGDYSNFYKHYNSLPNRPDYDGVVEDWEARKHWNENSGSPLYIDVSKLNLSPLTTASDFDKTTGVLQNNFFLTLGSDSRTAKVHGTLTMRLRNSNTGEVGIFNLTNTPRFFDTYDFNGDGRPLRDFSTWGARQVVGEGTGFGFIQYGKNPKIPVKK